MASGSGGSSLSLRKGYRVPKMELPIVKCDGCCIRFVKKYTTQTNIHGNLNRDFYKCPNHKPGDCDFWRWSDEYEDFFVDNGVLPPLNEYAKM